MHAEDYAKLVEDLEQELVAGARSVAILGMTDITLHLVASLASASLQTVLTGVYTSEVTSEDVDSRLPVPLRPVKSLSETHCDVLVVAADGKKEDFLLEALPYLHGTPK